MDGMRPVEPLRVDVEVYGGLLAEQLRLAGMAEPRVRTVVRDVVAHVRATGEDPVEAFGQPAEYAAQWADPPSALGVTLRLLGTSLGFVGVWAAIRAVLVGGPWGDPMDAYWSDVTIVATMVVVGAVVPWTVGRLLDRRAAGRVGSVTRPADTTIRTAATVVAVAVLMVVGSLVAPDGAGAAVLFAVPRWVSLAGGLAGMVLLFAVRSPDGRSMPRSPTDDRSLAARVVGLVRPGRRRP